MQQIVVCCCRLMVMEYCELLKKKTIILQKGDHCKDIKTVLGVFKTL